MKRTLSSYRFVVLTCLMLLMIGVQLGGFQLALSSASAQFGVGDTGMGLLVAAQYSSMIISPVLFGNLADRWGKKPVLLMGAAAILLGSALATVAGVVGVYALGIFFVGAGGMICESVCSAAVSDLHPEESTRLINLTQFFFSSGAILGPLALQWAMTRLGAPWQSLYVVYGAAFLVFLIPLARLKLQKPQAVPGASWQNPLRFLRRPAYRLLFIGILFYVGLENGMGCFVNTLFGDHLSTPAWGAYAISLFWAGTAVSRMVNGMRNRPAARNVPVHFALSGVLLLGLALSGTPVMSLVLSALVGYAYGPIWSELVALAAGEYPESSAGAVGLMGSGCGLGGALYPVLMGALADVADIRVGFVLLAVTAAVGCLLGGRYVRLGGRRS